MSAFISGGVATFEQSRKLAEYENRKASITFNVTGDEEADASVAVQGAILLAKEIVLDALGLEKRVLGEPQISKPAPPREGFEEKVLAGKVSPPANSEIATPKPTGRAKKPVVVVDSGLPTAGKPADPTDLTGGMVATAVAPGGIGGGPAATANDPTALDFLGEPVKVPEKTVMAIPEPVTDAYLRDAATRKAEKVGGEKVKALLLVHSGYPISAMPGDKRKQFLIDLEALK